MYHNSKHLSNQAYAIFNRGKIHMFKDKHGGIKSSISCSMMIALGKSLCSTSQSFYYSSDARNRILMSGSRISFGGKWTTSYSIPCSSILSPPFPLSPHSSAHSSIQRTSTPCTSTFLNAPVSIENKGRIEIMRSIHTTSSQKSNHSPDSSHKMEEKNFYVDSPSFLQLLFQYRYFVPFLQNGNETIPKSKVWKITALSVFNSLLSIILLFYILTSIEKFRRDYHITLGSLHADAQALLSGIIAVNVLLYLFSRHPKVSNFVIRRLAFMSGEVGMIPTITSLFCHSGIFHLAFNMFALNSFGGLMAELYGPEHFLFTYLSGGILGCVAATILDLLVLKHQKIYVGASGAILALVAMLAIYTPKSQIHIIFLPNYNFTVEKGVYGLMLFDTIGLILSKWYAFLPLGHAAHLGGMIAGLLYAYNYVNSPWKPQGIYPSSLDRKYRKDLL